MNKLFPLIVLVALLGTATATNTFITSIGRDFPIVQNDSQGNWKAIALFNDGTTVKMTYDTANTRWYTGATGDGFLTNNTVTFQATPGLTAAFYPPTVAGGHSAPFFNISANWTANFTGTSIVEGWFARGSLNTLAYNVSVYQNTNRLYVQYVAAGDATNFTYSLTPNIAAGDNISLVISPGIPGQSPHVIATQNIYSTAGSLSPPYPPSCTQGNICVNFFDNFSSVQNANNTQYINVSSGTTGIGTPYSLMNWNGSAWLGEAQSTTNAHLQKQTNGLFTGATGAASTSGTPFPGFLWSSTYQVTGSQRIFVNGTIRKLSCAGGDGITLRMVNGTTNFGNMSIAGSCANTSFQPFTFNATNLLLNTPVYIFVDGGASNTNDQFELANLTISGQGTNDGVYLNTFNELTGQQLYYNVTISNSTNSTLFVVNYSSFNKSVAELPSGLVTFTFKNSSCFTGNVIPRTLNIDTTTQTFPLNYSAYLLCDGATLATPRIHYLDLTGNTLPNVQVQLIKVINGVNQTLDVRNTDPSGMITEYVDQFSTYYLVASKTGFTTKVDSFTFNSVDYYIYMQSTTTLPGFAGLFETYGITYVMYPESLGIPFFQVNASVNGTGITYYGINLTLANSTQLYFDNETASSVGGLLSSTPIDRSGWNGTLFATLFIKAPGFPEFDYTRAYTFYNFTDTNASLTGFVNNLAADTNFSPGLRGFIALAASLLIATSVVGVGGAGAGIAFVAAFSFFWIALNQSEGFIYILVALATLAAYAVTRGIV